MTTCYWCRHVGGEGCDPMGSAVQGQALVLCAFSTDPGRINSASGVAPVTCVLARGLAAAESENEAGLSAARKQKFLSVATQYSSYVGLMDSHKLLFLRSVATPLINQYPQSHRAATTFFIRTKASEQEIRENARKLYLGRSSFVKAPRRPCSKRRMH